MQTVFRPNIKGAARRKERMEFLIGIGGRMGGRQAAPAAQPGFPERREGERERGWEEGVPGLPGDFSPPARPLPCLYNCSRLGRG